MFKDSWIHQFRSMAAECFKMKVAGWLSSGSEYNNQAKASCLIRKCSLSLNSVYLKLSMCVLPGRLMAGQLVLVQSVGVRVLPGQHRKKGCLESHPFLFLNP